MRLNITTCKQCEKLKAALEGLLDISTKEQLETMELVIRGTVAPEKDKTVVLNAIHALLDYDKN